MGFDALTYGAAVQAGKTYTDATAVTTAATAAAALAATLDYTPVAGSELDPAYNGSATC